MPDTWASSSVQSNVSTTPGIASAYSIALTSWGFDSLSGVKQLVLPFIIIIRLVGEFIHAADVLSSRSCPDADWPADAPRVFHWITVSTSCLMFIKC